MRKGFALYSAIFTNRPVHELFELQTIPTSKSFPIIPSCLAPTVLSYFHPNLSENFDSKVGIPLWKQISYSAPVWTEQDISSHASTPRISVPPSSSDNATVGMSSQFTGAKSPENTWLNLAKGVNKNLVGPEEKLSTARLHPKRIQTRRKTIPTNSQHGTYLSYVYTALEDAFNDPHRFDGRIGVFGGLAKNKI